MNTPKVATKSHPLRKTLAALLGAMMVIGLLAPNALAVSQAKTTETPYGTLTSNAWRQSGDGTISGNTRQWDYQVSAVIGGTQTVTSIKTTWTAGASLRNSANFSVTAGTSSVGVGAGSSWQYVSQTKYWNNTNGARSASYRSNMIATPQGDYRSGTISLANTAYVKFSGDTRNWQITASV